MEQKRILIIGGNGFIGSHLIGKLQELKTDITVLCRNPEEIIGLNVFKNIQIVQGDVTNYEDIEKNIKNQDVIINLATIVSTANKFDPYADLEVNCKGQINVLEARKNHNTKAQYIYIGSSMQFGKVDEKDLPIVEEYRQSPISLYGMHKVVAENYCNLYRKAFELSSIIVRFSVLYGPSITGKETRSIIEKFIKKALNNETFNVNGFGKDLKDLIYIDDAVGALIKIIDSPLQEGVFNVGSGKGVLFSDVAQIIVDECGSGNYALVPFPLELEPFEIGSFYFDITKIKNELGWSPKIDIQEGIKKTIDFYNNEKK